MKREKWMLFQFCLYGFLKNQQYFEPFFMLALLEKTRVMGPTLALTWVGALYGFRDICVNVLEVPSGAIADVLGRRRAMIASFAAYIGSFLILGLAAAIWALFIAMFLFALGQAFRTGTHKAMIFEWLQSQGRTGEKTAVYGFTRSWSKIGSAVSALMASGWVFITGSYSMVFLACVAPYLANMVNLLLYPRTLDGALHASRNIGRIFTTLWHSIRDCLRPGPLRRLVLESMGFEGMYAAGKDYLQLIIKAAAVAVFLPLVADWLREVRPGADPAKLAVTVLIGPVYCVLFLLGSYASRKADGLVRKLGNEETAARFLWRGDLVVFALMGLGVLLGWLWLAVVAFVALAVLQNLWRPILVARVADRAPAERQATILSVESQAKSLFVAVAAPLLGFSIDMLRYASGSDEYNYLPLAALGVGVSLAMLLTGRSRVTCSPRISRTG